MSSTASVQITRRLVGIMRKLRIPKGDLEQGKVGYLLTKTPNGVGLSVWCGLRWHMPTVHIMVSKALVDAGIVVREPLPGDTCYWFCTGIKR